MLVLLGIAVVVVGFVVRANPLLVIIAAALTTGLAAAYTPGVSAQQLYDAALHTLATFGKAFNDNRFVTVIWLTLAAVGLLERAGLQERARIAIANVKAATTGRLLLIYLVIRQVTAALGLTQLGGQAQMVRPLVAPMAEASAETRYGALPDKERYRIRAYAAATDNVGVFFGEDIFVAIGSILVIKATLEASGIIVEPLQLTVWAIPTAIVAFLIHGARLLLLDRALKKRLGAPQ